MASDAAQCVSVMRIEVDAKSNFREFLKNAAGHAD